MTASRVFTGLAPFPDNDLPKREFNLVSPLYTAFQNLISSISRATGIDGNPPATWSVLRPVDTIFTGQATKLYAVAAVALPVGSIVNLFNNGGIINARLANAGSASTMAHGIVTSVSAAGAVAEIQWLRGLSQSISGLTVGSLYYLSTSSGLITATRPSTAGSIIQPIGVAFDSSTLLVDIPLSYIQL